MVLAPGFLLPFFPDSSLFNLVTTLTAFWHQFHLSPSIKKALAGEASTKAAGLYAVLL
ncbi:hypothetical protein ANACAC_01439 [Anaerostipes caccae L1-92]|uniref:Uncharacterized protein n=1 Tax=Anaerostipes caccae (strain DSM 14662 / CCUG 47493 / JCM 13470 / NCIMB 13811 / L1-92) TaxID=411490 RepID=B0MCZ7_ANACD|nr:hypothetical protein ANACAC_01439 [Anaerostipes caccae L1-92]